jgi:hypothetical protein
MQNVEPFGKGRCLSERADPKRIEDEDERRAARSAR